MTSVAESAGIASSQMNAELVAGLKLLSRDQTVTFTKYVRLVLPLDGFVFWVNASLVSPSAVYNTTPYNAATYDQPQVQGAPPKTLSGVAPYQVKVQGSLHYNAANQQNEDESVSINRVVFTTQNEIQDLNSVGENEVYIGEFDFPPEPECLSENAAGRSIRFAFSAQGYFYRAAGLWHYQGDAIYAAMESQIIDSVTGFDAQSLVVSNSLPIWLSFASMPTPIWAPPRQRFPVYPSFAVPTNTRPPYATVHVAPDGTEALAAAPFIDQLSSHFQLAVDWVRVTFYGVRNDGAQDFMDAVNGFTVDTDLMGLMNSPVVRDEKRTQAELGILAMKKTAEFRVNYYQRRINDFAIQTIKQAIPAFLVPG